MPMTRAVVLLLGALAAGNAFRVPLRMPPTRMMAARAHVSRIRLDVTDGPELAALAGNLTATQRLMRGLPNLPSKLLSAAIVAAWAGAGLAVLPEALGTTALTMGVGGFGGVGSKFARKAWSQRQAAAASALAELLRDQGVGNVTQAQIDTIAKELGVPSSYFEVQKADVYGAVLKDVLAEASVSVPEIGELQQLRKVLALPGNAVGEKHVERGREILARGGAQVSDRQGPEWERLKKLLFLTECTMPRKPPPGWGAGAEEGEAPGPGDGGRLVRLLEAIEKRTTVKSLLGRQVREALRPYKDPKEAGPGLSTAASTMEALYTLCALTPEEGEAITTATALPFYQKAVHAAIARIGPQTGDSLERVRSALRLDLSDVGEVHAEVYGSVVDRCVAGGRLLEDDMPTLDLVAETLLLRRKETQPIIESRTKPLYASAVRETLREELRTKSERPLQAWGRLAMRQKELSLPNEAAEDVLADELSEVARPQYEALAESVAADDGAAALAAAQELVRTARLGARFISSFRTNRVSSETDFAGLRDGYLSAVSKGGPTTPETYSKFLDAAGAQLAAFGAEEEDTLGPLGALLGLAEADARQALQGAGLRVLRDALDAACGAWNGDAAAFDSVKRIERTYSLPKDVAEKARLDALYERMLALSEASSSVTAEELRRLSALCAALDISADQLRRLDEATDAVKALFDNLGSGANEEEMAALRKRLRGEA